MDGRNCNAYDISHLDEGILVPPRKRLLAGFNKHNSRDQSSASPPSIKADNYAKTLLGPYSSGYSLEEIAESSYKAALAAAKVADNARAVAEEKASIAAKAIAAAKTALNLVAAFYEETSSRGSHSKKNQSKKRVSIRCCAYEKHDEIENEFTDENQLSQLMHKTSGFSKQWTPSSDFKSLKQKRLKISHVIEKTKVPRQGIFNTDSLASFNRDTKCSNHEVARKQLIQMVERRVELS